MNLMSFVQIPQVKQNQVKTLWTARLSEIRLLEAPSMKLVSPARRLVHVGMGQNGQKETPSGTTIFENILFLQFFGTLFWLTAIMYQANTSTVLKDLATICMTHLKPLSNKTTSVWGQ